jgi:predicted PhzF superfamily epimerase YddE/YHI9
MSTQTIPYHIVDAFATGPFTGNQAPVVITSTPLSSELMQKMAACVHLILICLDSFMN